MKAEEVEAVLGGARLVDKREPIAEAIRRAAIVEDALALFVHILELARPHGPGQQAHDEQGQNHRKRDQQKKNVHSLTFLR